MKRNGILVAATLALTGVMLFATGCQKLKARDELNKGVKAYKNAQYEEAVEHFKVAVELDPEFPTSRLYLATAYMSQYIPGADSPENLRMAEAAERHFKEVLDQDPNNAVAIESLASLYYNQAGAVASLEEKMQRFDVAKDWYERLSQVEPQKKEAPYSLGVIAFGKYFPAIGAARADAGMKPEDLSPLKDTKVRTALREEYLPIVERGIDNLQKAVDIDPQYDDAMAYLNLLYRHGAAIANSDEEHREMIAKADDWLDKTMQTKKIKAEAAAQASAGITMD